jgi:hypothetical protein
MELDVALVAWHPDLCEARHLPRRADEARVAAPTVPTPRDHDSRVRLREVGDEVTAVEDLRPNRDPHLDRLPVGAVLARTAAVAAFPRVDRVTALQIREIAEGRIGHEHHVAAPSAVAAIGPALGDELLAAERQTAVAAATGLDVKLRPVAERGY